MAKYLVALAAVVILVVGSVAFVTSGHEDLLDDQYLAGFDDGSEAFANGLNAQTCADHYRKQNLPPAPECHKYLNEFSDGMKKYQEIMAKRATKKGNTDGQGSTRNFTDTK